MFRLNILKTENDIKWTLTDKIEDAWNLVFKKSQYIGASMNQLGYLTIQMNDLESQFDLTFSLIKTIFGNGPYPAVDVFESEEYCIIPEWYFGSDEISKSFTNKKTISHYQQLLNITPINAYSAAVKIGKWIRTSAIYGESLENIEFPKRPFIIRVRISTEGNNFGKEMEKIRKVLDNKLVPKPLTIIPSCKKLPNKAKFSISFQFSSLDKSATNVKRRE
jgi:hypothetical protein